MADKRLRIAVGRCDRCENYNHEYMYCEDLKKNMRVDEVCSRFEDKAVPMINGMRQFNQEDLFL